jgi:hypothetical protein
MNRLKLRMLAASLVAASVVVLAAICAQFGQAALSSALSIYALGAGAWLYHSIERYVVAKRLNTVIDANRLNPFRSMAKPLLPVMAAVIGLTQVVVRALSDVTDLEQRRDLRPIRYFAITRGSRRRNDIDEP